MIYRTKFNRFVNEENKEVSESEYIAYLEKGGVILETDFNFEDDVEVPLELTRRQFKIALAVLGYKESDITDGIEKLEEPMRTVARISYVEAGTFERNNPELVMVAKDFLKLSDKEIDKIFITGKEY